VATAHLPHRFILNNNDLRDAVRWELDLAHGIRAGFLRAGSGWIMDPTIGARHIAHRSCQISGRPALRP